MQSNIINKGHKVTQGYPRLPKVSQDQGPSIYVVDLTHARIILTRTTMTCSNNESDAPPPGQTVNQLSKGSWNY